MVYQEFYTEGSKCPQEGSFAPNPADCGSFLMCNHGKYIVRPCGGGLHWDNKIKACNSIDLAECKPGEGASPGIPGLPVEAVIAEEPDL